MKSIKKTKSSLHAAVLAGPITALLTLALGAGSALATDGAWGVNSSGNWSDATKWAGGINIANGVGATADLSGSVISSSNKTITMDSARTLGKVMLGASSRNLDIATGSNILTLDDTFNAGTNPLGDNVVEITYRAGSGRNGSIGVPIELKNNLLISNPDNTGNTGILISGGLSSSNGNLTITNNSNLNSRTKFNSTVSDGAPGNSITYIQTVGWTEFNNPNTFTGTTTNVAGSIVLRNSLALQNSALDTAASGVGNGADPGNGLKIKVAALTLGTTGTDLSSTVANGTTTPVITLNVPTASATNRGALSSADWSTFNSKQPVSAPVTKTADFTVAATEVWLINNKSGSTCTVTLPTPSTNSGRVLYFQNYQTQALVSASSNVVPLAGGAAGTSSLLASSGDSATLVSDGTNWLMTQYVPNNILLLG